MSVLNNSNAISTGGAYNITDSLRFRDAQYLTRTPSSAGNRKTWTWSAWVKRGNFDASNRQSLVGVTSAASDSNWLVFGFDTSNKFFVTTYSAVTTTTAVYRDVSAWYHIVVAFDSTQSTGADRIKIYVNGVQQIHNSGWTPTLNTDYAINSAAEHRIGGNADNANQSFDGYMTEVNFVDGQALTPSDFGETNANGVWSPKEYTGTYGTNGFYLPMKETTQASGFNTVLYKGTNATQSITGVGFSPDLIWLKSRSNGSWWHNLYDTVRGVGKRLASNDTDSEFFSATSLSSFDSDGFSLGSDNTPNYNGDNYVAWCWDAGSSTVSNTDGTITSSVRANPASGFSIATFNAAASGSFTVGHGLGTAPKVVITRYRNIASDWYTYHESIGNTKFLKLNSTAAEATNSGIWNNTSPTSTVFTLGSSIAGSSSWTMVAYCFSEVSGFSKFGSYTGNGSTSGPTITTGFTPAFVMMKRTDSTSNWLMFDRTRGADDNLNDNYLYANSAGTEGTSATLGIEITSTGFVLKNAYVDANASGGTYIYMAFADTRDFQWNFDASGNKNNWTPNNINSNASGEPTYDLMSDTPSLADEDTGNFATLNPLNVIPYGSVSDGNLKFTGSATDWSGVYSSIKIPSTGKWYAECVVGSTTNNSNQIVFGFQTFQPLSYTVTNFYGHGHNSGFFLYNNGTASTNGGFATPAGTLLQIAIDADAGKAWYGYNNNWYDTYNTTNGNPSAGTNPYATGINFSTSDFYFVLRSYVNNGSVNFGQRPFKYTPPTGYKKLNTYNLPDSTIADGSQYMNPVLYTGNGTSQSITGVGFQPDLVWLKSRSNAFHHYLVDSIRGDSKYLRTSSTNAEATNVALTINSDGFSLDSTSDAEAVNNNASTYVAWNWRGSDSTAVSNTDGTITSTVSANPTSGFSVVTWTGNGANSTIGHGLGISPKFIIVKQRNAVRGWVCYNSNLASNQVIYLNVTNASNTDTTAFNATAPTSSVFTVGTSADTNQSGGSYVAYCFSNVEGFSKFGSYTGNGSADGPFIFTNFRPAFVMTKRTDSTSNWILTDTGRSPDNESHETLYANLSNAEVGMGKDLLSNGFKCRTTDANINASGGTYIYMCFSENPFKGSLAR